MLSISVYGKNACNLQCIANPKEKNMFRICTNRSIVSSHVTEDMDFSEFNLVEKISPKCSFMFDYEKVENRKQYQKNMGSVYIHFL
jgi:hypothetical protein